MFNKAINSFKLAKGAGVLRCDWCAVLRKHGVNSTQAMRELGVFPKEWAAKLAAHEQWHVDRGEELPIEMTEAGLTKEFIAQELTPRPRVYRHEESMADYVGQMDRVFK